MSLTATMTDVIQPAARTAGALYPPTVAPHVGTLKQLQFAFKNLGNPLAALPAAVYEEPIVFFGKAATPMAWVTGRRRTKRVALSDFRNRRCSGK